MTKREALSIYARRRCAPVFGREAQICACGVGAVLSTVTDDTLRHGDSMALVTVTDAAKRLGITRTAVYNRIKRGTLQTQANNRGHQLVILDDTVTDDTVHVTVGRSTPTPLNQAASPMRPPATEMVPAFVHRDVVALLLERVDAAEVRAERAERMLVKALAERRRRWWPW